MLQLDSSTDRRDPTDSFCCDCKGFGVGNYLFFFRKFLCSDDLERTNGRLLIGRVENCTRELHHLLPPPMVPMIYSSLSNQTKSLQSTSTHHAKQLSKSSHTSIVLGILNLSFSTFSVRIDDHFTHIPFLTPHSPHTTDQFRQTKQNTRCRIHSEFERVRATCLPRNSGNMDPST